MSKLKEPIGESMYMGICGKCNRIQYHSDTLDELQIYLTDSCYTCGEYGVLAYKQIAYLAKEKAIDKEAKK